jgi:SSS family solute:Na+ symporter
MNFDVLVIIGYFLLMAGISITFRRMASHSSTDYFRGGGRMLWWMVGSSAFMVQFSAWTFTGAAGEAFRNGFPAVYVFIGNAFAYIVAWLFFAAKFRQMRVDTPTEAIRRRFGETSEQFFTWSIIPLSVVQGGVWLNALAVFFSAVTGVDLTITLWLTGSGVLLLSLFGGAWGVVASDFVQSMIVAVMSVACALVALVKVGGPAAMAAKFPIDFFIGPNVRYPAILVGLFLFMLVKQMLTINNMKDSYRFLTAKDSPNATKAALFAFFLMAAGALIWMIPPWVSAVLFPDAATSHAAELGGKASDAVYLVFAERAMPAGMVGLLMAGMLSATISSMDSALNQNAGIFVRSFYQPVIRKNKGISEREALLAGKGINIVNGIMIILIAQFYASMNTLSLFELMMRVSTLAQVPILIPLFLGLLIKKIPDWAAWATVLFGLLVSYLVSSVWNAAEIASLLGHPLSQREISECNTILTMIAHIFLTGGFFCLCTLFYRAPPAESARSRQLTSFYIDLATPVAADGEQGEFDRLQNKKMGEVTVVMGFGLLSMVMIPNPLWGRLIYFAGAAVILSIGYFMLRSVKDIAVANALDALQLTTDTSVARPLPRVN